MSACGRITAGSTPLPVTGSCAISPSPEVESLRCRRRGEWNSQRCTSLTYVESLPEERNGAQILQGGVQESRTRDAQAQARYAEKRRQREEGEEPQAGDRHRAVGGAPRRQEGAEEEKEGWQEAEEEVLKFIALAPR